MLHTCHSFPASVTRAGATGILTTMPSQGRAGPCSSDKCSGGCHGSGRQSLLAGASPSPAPAAVPTYPQRHWRGTGGHFYVFQEKRDAQTGYMLSHNTSDLPSATWPASGSAGTHPVSWLSPVASVYRKTFLQRPRETWH